MKEILDRRDTHKVHDTLDTMFEPSQRALVHMWPWFTVDRRILVEWKGHVHTVYTQGQTYVIWFVTTPFGGWTLTKRHKELVCPPNLGERIDKLWLGSDIPSPLFMTATMSVKQTTSTMLVSLVSTSDGELTLKSWASFQVSKSTCLFRQNLYRIPLTKSMLDQHMLVQPLEK